MTIFKALRDGLTRSRQSLGVNLAKILPNQRLDAASLARLEEVLISADIGVVGAGDIVAHLRAQKN